MADRKRTGICSNPARCSELMGRFKLADIPTCIGYFRVPAEPKADGDLGRPRTAKMKVAAAVRAAETEKDLGDLGPKSAKLHLRRRHKRLRESGFLKMR